MNPHELLIEKVKLLIQSLAGTQAGEGELVKEIYHIINQIENGR